jgi:hypothetical protein
VWLELEQGYKTILDVRPHLGEVGLTLHGDCVPPASRQGSAWD